MRLLIVEIAFLTFVTIFLLQAIISRIHRPKSEDKFVIGLYTLTPVAAFVLSSFFNYFEIVSPPEALAALILSLVIGSSWVASYPAIYAVCPTLVMAYVIRKSPQGITASELVNLLALKQNSTERLEDALHDNLVRINGDNIELTRGGQIVYHFFRAYRRVIGLKMDTL